MGKSFLTEQEILRAISRGLQPGIGTLRTFIISLAVLILLLVFLERSLRHSSSRKSKESALATFEKRIRKLDLTINEIDYLNLMSTCLKKPWKKYLLLTNKTAFTNCLSLLESQHPGSLRLDLIHSLSRKAGFEMQSVPGETRGTRKVYPGAPVKIVTGSSRLYSGEVTKTDSDHFEFRTKEPLPDNTGEFTVYLIDFSGISGFQTKISARLPGSVYRAPHSETVRSLNWENPGQAGVDTQVFILSDGTGDIPFHARLSRIRPGWMILEEPAQPLKKGTDIRIFLTKTVSGGFWVNGEIARVSRDGKTLMVRLNHVKPRPS